MQCAVVGGLIPGMVAKRDSKCCRAAAEHANRFRRGIVTDIRAVVRSSGAAPVTSTVGLLAPTSSFASIRLTAFVETSTAKPEAEILWLAATLINTGSTIRRARSAYLSHRRTLMGPRLTERD
jgi:hypothetical protein